MKSSLRVRPQMMRDVCAVKTVSSVKPNVTQAVRSQTDKSGQTSQKQGIGFKKGNLEICLQDHLFLLVLDSDCGVALPYDWHN
ncbi:hypothetical protein Tco_1093998 [Tanacetum coccineum]|uniref:Uncharacterized protein n=1 Tax=Tanacetum coccineum TaxID=301880 RepID=A0ABQ5IEA8_9ASTR